MVRTPAFLYGPVVGSWGLSAATWLLIACGLSAVELDFFLANLMKIFEGGWIPLALAAVLFVVMTTWRSGVAAVRGRLDGMTEPPAALLRRLHEQQVPRVPGTAVFLTRTLEQTPPLI